MRVLHVDCGLRVGVRLAVAAVTAACLVNGGCAASKFPPITIGDAAPLLKDPDPKVRTLGIVMLYYKGGAPAVNEIVALVDDDAETYPQPAFGGVTIRDPWPMIKQKVKDLATQIVQRHLTITNTGGISGHTLKDAWRRYWSIRKDRPYATADFVTALDRAAGGTSPIRPERMPAIQRVADNVRQLPMPDRFFIMHAMWFHMGGRFPDTRQTPVVSRDELVAMARELPVETRWMMAHGRIATDDPDLPKWTSYDIYRDARRIVRSVDP